MAKVHIETQKLVFNDVFKIEEVRLQYERFDGKLSRPIRRLNFMRGDSVAAVVLNEDTQRILLTNQFKYPTFEKGPGWISEIVAGVVERDELPEQAIRREILEELGYRARDLTYVSTFYVSPGGTSERIILYSTRVRNADKVQAGGGLDSEDEDIKLVEIPLNDLNNVLQREEIQDAKTLVGLMWLMNESKDR